MGINRFAGHGRLVVTTASLGVRIFDAPSDDDCVNWNVDKEGHLNVFETLNFADESEGKRVNTKIATMPSGQWLEVVGYDEIPVDASASSSHAQAT